MSSCKPGDRVRLIYMPNDPDPIPAGATGTVIDVTDGAFAQITVAWDNRRSLALVPGVDEFAVIGHTDLVAECLACPECHNPAMDLLEWGEDYEKVTCSLCHTVYEP